MEHPDQVRIVKDLSLMAESIRVKILYGAPDPAERIRIKLLVNAIKKIAADMADMAGLNQ